MMEIYLFVLLAAHAIFALPVEEPQTRLNGENGWFVPQIDGNFQWYNAAEAEAKLSEYAQQESLNRLSLNGVKFYLYTRENPEDPQEISATEASIEASNFNAENPTKFTIHGWNSNYKDGINTRVRRAWFKYGNYNMIAVDWARGRSVEYFSSVSGVPGTGAKIAALIDFLVKEYKMSLDTLEVIGFSLGAQVAGFTGKSVSTGSVQKIVGLDPAMPLFSYDKPEKRLSATDAKYVETIQTNGGVMGFKQPIGQAAFYPNGGLTQPGCNNDMSCSHTRAVIYHVESIELDNFPTIKCSTYKDANKHTCGSTFSSVRMGSAVNQHIANGEFYVPINRESPFGLGVQNDNNTKNIYIVNIILSAMKITK